MKGWLTVLAWQSLVASAEYLSGTMVQGLLILSYPDYAPQQWHGTLLFWAAIIVSVFFNTVVSGMLPKIEGLILILHYSRLAYHSHYFGLPGPRATALEVSTLFINQGN